jgi:hypothetical protein
VPLLSAFGSIRKYFLTAWKSRGEEISLRGMPEYGLKKKKASMRLWRNRFERITY